MNSPITNKNYHLDNLLTSLPLKIREEFLENLKKILNLIKEMGIFFQMTKKILKKLLSIFLKFKVINEFIKNSKSKEKLKIFLKEKFCDEFNFDFKEENDIEKYFEEIEFEFILEVIMEN